MASCNFNFDDSFMKQLEKMGNSDKIIPKMLEGIAPIIVEEEKAELKNTVGRSDRSTGSMINSIKATKTKSNKWGHYIVVRPTGKDKNGVRNMEKFIYNEYGTSQQRANPIQKKVVNETSSKIEEKAQKIFNQEVGI